ncbi:MAG: MBOAT family O-acyltransferase [Devosia sp.]|nr:MBOAT family O-acyltransferase [Devosia sp.]
MVFSSVEFLFLFLPIFLLVYFLSGGRNAVYALFSLIFYFIGEGWFVAIVVASVAANYFLGRWIDDAADVRERYRLICVGVSLNLAALIVFKYAGFIVSNLPALGSYRPRLDLHLPLGISFFTFHSISYLIDIYRRDAAAERKPLNLALYILMFPQLIAGPILRFHTISKQLETRSVNLSNIYNGLALFCFGLGQKTIIADTIAGAIDPLFTKWQTLNAVSAWLAAIGYTFQIYFDFSGYSNMAIGLGWVTGFYFQKNFDFPYVSQSITEFWRRWHMSLSRWFRDYLYVPLGGNRAGVRRTYVNLATVFVLCGLWHGAAWTFLVWGAYHGVMLVVERLGLDKALTGVPRALRHVYALLVVVVGWVVFRADSLEEARHIYAQMFTFNGGDDPLNPVLALSGEEIAAFACALAFSIPITVGFIGKAIALPTAPGTDPLRLSLRLSAGIAAAAAVFALSVLKIITGSFSPFIYFRF